MDHIVTDYYINHDPEVYEKEHRARIEFAANFFGIKKYKNSKVADFGCGNGILLSLFDDSNLRVGFDGARIDSFKCKMLYYQVDLNKENSNWTSGEFDCACCCEVLEHLENPYRCLWEMKNHTKKNANIFLSLPDVSVTHPTIYPSLIYPESNFEEFLGQLALPIIEKSTCSLPWKMHHYICRNAPMEEANHKFPKPYLKFYGQPPHVYCNL